MAGLKHDTVVRTDQASGDDAVTFAYEATSLQRNTGLQSAGAAPVLPFIGMAAAETRSSAVRVEVRPGVVADDALLASLGLMPATAFQSPVWMKAWQDHVECRSGAMPVTAIGYIGTAPAFILPLSLKRSFHVRVLSWHGAQLNDYCAPITGAAYRAAAASLDARSVLRQIAEVLGGVDLVHLSKMPAEVAGLANPFLLPGTMTYHARAHAVSLPRGESFEAFYAARRSSKTRRRIKDKLNALERLGGVRFAFAQTAEEARRVAEICLAGKSRQLQRAGHWDPFSDPAVREFAVSSFATGTGVSTWACSLSVGGEVQATAIGFRGARSWLLYQMSMEDTGKERHSPGTHLLMNILQQCVAENAEELDLGLGDESYKTEWCDIDRTLMISDLALTMKGHVLAQAMKARAAILPRLSANPAVHRAAKRLQRVARMFRIPA